MSYYIHNIPGRLRVRTPRIKGNPAEASLVEKQLLVVPGVSEVTANPITGSIVINYDPIRITQEELLDLFHTRGYLDLSKAVTNAEVIEDSVKKAGKVVGKALLGMILDKALEGSALSVLSAML